ncbi:MAG: TspO/MBR family protein [Ferrovibrio sp.]
MSPRRIPQTYSAASIAGLVLSTLVCFGVSALGGAITAEPVKRWYPDLAKPALTPPDIAFPIVWTLLFALMALAAWRVWRAAGWHQARGALALFGLQLVLNLGWSALFFGLQQPGWALAEIVVLAVAIGACMAAFARHDRIAALLLAPYLLWVGFAAYLNAAIWLLNPA